MPIAEDSAGGSPVPVPTDLTTNLTGEATGSGTLDYTTGDIDIVVTVVDNGHNHILSNITDVQVNNAISGQILVYNGTVWANATNTSGITALVQDLSPALGGNLDLNNRNITGTGNIAITGTIDGRDVSADGTKLDGIESGATADQTAAQIKTAYESNANTNNFADADVSKLSGIEPGATADQTAAQIKTAYESNSNTNAFTDADHTKLDGIETAADVTDTTNVVASLTAGTNVTIAADGTISATGGTSGIAHVVDDTSPELGGNLSLNSHDITGTGNLNFTGSVTLSGTVDGRDVAADGTKLDGIEAGANITDTANVTAAGALMDSEVTNLAQVKAFDSSDYATAAQGTTADAALPTTGGTMTGDILFNDGVKAKYGTSSDLQIYHDGSNSYINEIGAGDLVLQTNGAKIGLASASPFEWLLEAVPNDAVTLYYDGSAKLATVSGGIDVTGTIKSNGSGYNPANTGWATNASLITSGSYGGGLTFVDGSAGYSIRVENSGADLVIGQGATSGGLAQKVKITSTGIDVTGAIDVANPTNYTGIHLRGNGAPNVTFGRNSVTTAEWKAGISGNLGTSFTISEGTAAASERLTIATGGDVSIPSGNLNVTGKITVASTDPEIFLTDTSTSVTHSIDGNSGVGNLFMHVDKDETGSDPKFIVNVGSQDNVLVVKNTGVDVIGNIDATSSGGSTLTLENSITSISANELIGGIDFKGNDTSEDGNEVLAYIRAHALDTTPDSYIAFGTLQNNGGVDDVVTERMRLDNYGRLGVGHTSPVAKMAILGSSNSTVTEANSNLCVEGSGGNGMLFGTLNTTGFKSYIQSGFVSNLGTATYDLLLNPEGGNVGVGTTAPAAKLDVRGDVRIEATSGFAFMEMGGPSGAFIDLKSPFSDDYDLRVQQDGGQSKIRTTGTSVQIDTSGGYLHLGPQNTSYCHFTTDRTRYYFNQNLVVAGNRVVSSYGGDLLLQREQSSSAEISIGLSQVVMTGQLNISGANPSSNNGAFEVPVINSSTPAIVSVSAGTTSLRTHHSFENSNGQVGKINTLGTQTFYVTSSDYRLKTDIQPMQGSIDRVKALKPCNFEWINDGGRVDGFIAHEAQEVVPEAIVGEKDAMRDKVNIITPLIEATYDEEGNELTSEIPAVTETEQVPDYQGIDQSKIVPLLTSALQDAIAKIEALETRLTALES